MKSALRNVLILAILFVLARFLAIGSLTWADAFLNDRIFEVYFDFFTWGTVIAWLFPALIFLALGALVAALVVGWNPILVAFLFGSAYGLDRWAHSTYRIYSPSLHGYIDLYGGLFVPPIAACIGAWLWQVMAARFDGPNAA